MATTAALRRVVRRQLRSAVSGPPLRGAQVELLQVVERQPGIGIARAGCVLHLAANSVSTLVNQLIDIGMLVRQTAPDDRRVAQLWLTEAATQRLAAWRQASIGTIEVFGVDVARHKLAVRRLIGYVPQQLSADGSLTGRQNVALFARLFDVPRARRRRVVDDSLESVGLADVADRTAG